MFRFISLCIVLTIVGAANIWNKKSLSKPIFVLFYSSQNDNSLQLLKTWKKLPMDDNVDIGTYNCDDDSMSLCHYLNEIPSIQWGEPYQFKTYTEKRTLKPLKRFIRGIAPLCDIETGDFCSKHQTQQMEIWSKNKAKYRTMLHDQDKELLIDKHKFEDAERKLKETYETLRKNFTKKMKQNKDEQDFGLLKRFILHKKNKKEL